MRNESLNEILCNGDLNAFHQTEQLQDGFGSASEVKSWFSPKKILEEEEHIYRRVYRV